MTSSPVKILGAGIKGLSLAYFLRQKGISSVIHEKSDRAGGWIKTLDTPNFLFEAGPRGFRSSSIIMDMVHSLNLTDKLLYPDAAAKKRFLYLNQKITPTSSLLPQLAWGLLRDFVLPKSKQEQTIYDYFSYRLGEKCTTTFIDALVSGIYAGDIKLLSAQKCFPSMTSKGSILKSMLSQPKHPLISFQGGLQTLIAKLTEHQEIVYESSPEVFDYDCTPDPATPKVSIVSVNLGWKNQSMNYKGFGYLIPQKERQPILGVVFDSCTFPQQNRTSHELRLTAMMGGAHHPELIHLPDDQIIDLTLNALHKHLSIHAVPDEILVHRAFNAIPQPYLNSNTLAVGVTPAIEAAYHLASKHPA